MIKLYFYKQWPLNYPQNTIEQAQKGGVVESNHSNCSEVNKTIHSTKQYSIHNTE